MSLLIEEIENRWRQMFDDLAKGWDLPPAARLRTEGLMEAAVLLELCSEEALSQRMNELHTRCFGIDLASQFGQQWQQFYPFPQIPAMQQRAPVVPSIRSD